MSNTKTPSRCTYVRQCKNIIFRYNNQTIMPFFIEIKKNRTINMPFIIKSEHFDYKNPYK